MSTSISPGNPAAAPSKAPEIIVVGIIFMIINTAAIGTRTYSQIIGRKFGLNDAGMVLVLAIFAVLVAFAILGAHSGIGQHTSTVLISGAKNFSDSLKWIFFLELFYVFLTTVMKASVAATYLGWAKSTTQKVVLWGSILLDVTIGCVVIVYTILQCTPVDLLWRGLEPTAKGTCRSPKVIIRAGYALCAITFTLDMLFLIMPFILMKHHKPNSIVKKYIFGIIFIGILASVANFIRLAALAKLGTYKDPLFDAADVFIWSFLEVGLGITVAGILKLDSLMQRLGVKGFEKDGDSFENVDVDIDAHRLVVIEKGKTVDE